MSQVNVLKILPKILLGLLCVLLMILGSLITISLGFTTILDSFIVLIFVVMLSGLLLTAYYGAIAVSIYLLLGALGLPILPEGQSGLSVFISPMAGYLLGLIPCVVTCGMIGGIPVKKELGAIFKACLFAHIVLLSLGSTILYVANKEQSLAEVLAVAFTSFIPWMLVICTFSTLSYKIIAGSNIVTSMDFIKRFNN